MMRKRPRATRLILLVSVTAFALTLSGCVYLRLLHFKNQLKAFDENVTVLPRSELIFQFQNPIVKDSDFVFISGSAPGRIEAVPHATHEEIWTWQFEKRLKNPTDRPYSMNFKTRFKDGLLTRMEIDKTFVNLVGRDLVLTMFRNIGAAKINKIRRTMTSELSREKIPSLKLPSLQRVHDIMGEPTKISKSKGETLAKNEYEFNFHDPKNGKKAGQFRLIFSGDPQNPDNPITGFRVMGKAK